MTHAAAVWAGKCSAKSPNSMSRIGKLPIPLPDGVTATLKDQHVAVKGPKGELSLVLHPTVSVTQADGGLTVNVKNPDSKSDRALWGLSRQLVANMVQGVTKGFEKKLELVGVGFKVQASGQSLTLNLGFSHPVEFTLPQGVAAAVEKNTITISGIDKQLVGETSAKIRALKKPEPYKGKGIKYSDEVVRRKAGKVVKAAGAK
jgi:large subunit ribosomal protein L6